MVLLTTQGLLSVTAIHFWTLADYLARLASLTVGKWLLSIHRLRSVAIQRERSRASGARPRAHGASESASCVISTAAELARRPEDQRDEATVLQVKLESSSDSLRADSPSRVRALPRAVCDALDCGRRSGSEVQLGVAGATRCRPQPFFTAGAPSWVSVFRVDRAGYFTRDMADSR
jgi:hypothetical protein